MSDPQFLPDDNPEEQLSLWPSSNSSTSGSTSRRRTSQPTEKARPQQLSEDLRLTLKALARIERTVATVSTQQNNHKALLQELHSLQSLPAEMQRIENTLSAVEADLRDFETLPEILQHQEQQLERQAQILQQQAKALQEMKAELSRVKSALPGVLNHPLKAILNGRELSLKSVLTVQLLSILIVVGLGERCCGG